MQCLSSFPRSSSSEVLEGRVGDLLTLEDFSCGVDGHLETLVFVEVEPSIWNAGVRKETARQVHGRKSAPPLGTI